MDILNSIIDEEHLNIHFDNRMPSKQGGLIFNNDIYINPRKSTYEQHEYLAEEIGHYKTTVGDIIDQKFNLNNRKQEQKARDYGCKLLVTLDGLIECYKSYLTTEYEIAEYFQVTVPYLRKSINMYRRKFGDRFTYKQYIFDLSNGLFILPQDN